MQFYLKTFDQKKLLNISRLYILAGVLTAFMGLILFNYYPFINKFYEIGIVDRTRSFSSGYMVFSSYLLTGLGIFVGFPNLFKKKWDWIATAVGISIILSAIITSLGRTNVAIALLIFVFGIAFKKINFKQVILIIIITAGLTLISFKNNSDAVEVSNRSLLCSRIGIFCLKELKKNF